MGEQVSRMVLSRRQMLRGFATIAGSSVLSGCGSLAVRSIAAAPGTAPVEVPTGGAVPVYSNPSNAVSAPQMGQPVPTGAIAQASMSVALESIGSFGPGSVGLAYEKSDVSRQVFSAANAELLALFRLLGKGVLCIGGSSVDATVWAQDGEGQVQGQIAPVDVDELAAFLKATGWSCIYGVNLGGSADGATTPALAAAEVAYVAQRLGAQLIGIELGSACERYGDPGAWYAGSWSVERFETLWKEYRDAITATMPNAPMAGPAAASDVDGWTLPFGEYVTANNLTMLTQQYARTASTVASAADLLAADATLEGELLQLKYGAQSIGVPYRLTRCSAVDGGGVDGVSNAYSSALWAVDAALEAAASGAAGLSIACGSGEIGAPITDAAGVVTAVQPGFYGLLLASMVGQGAMLSTQMNAGSLNVSGYAVQHADGSFTLVVVNKDPTTALQVALTLPSSASTATLMAMTQVAESTAGAALQSGSGAALQSGVVAVDGSFMPGEPYVLPVSGAAVSFFVPSLSAVLVRVQ